jgi:hypothetical protein
MNLIAAECWVRPMAAGYLPHKLDSGIPPAAAAGTMGTFTSCTQAGRWAVDCSQALGETSQARLA